MASTGFQHLSVDIKKSLELDLMRKAELHVCSLTVKEYVAELQYENKQLREELIKLHKALGSTCFNPVQI